MNDDDAIYREVEQLVAPIMRSNARRFAAQLGMSLEDAMQEARLGLIAALRRYDYNNARGGIYNFVKTAIRRHFLKLWAVHSAQARSPHVHTVNAEGKRVAVYAGYVRGDELDFMDTFESHFPSPDTDIEETDGQRALDAFLAALEGALKERDREVLRCKCNPPLGLRMLMIEELTEEPTIPLIGRHLGLSKNEVDWALKRIRAAASKILASEFSELADLAIVRSYVE